MTLDVVSKTGKTPVLGRMLSKYVGHKMSSIENEITKTRNHSRQRGNMMRTVFGIDVSKASSEVAIVINGEKIHGYTMPNDTIGFTRLLDDLKPFKSPRSFLKQEVSIRVVFKHFLKKMDTLIHS